MDKVKKAIKQLRGSTGGHYVVGDQPKSKKGVATTVRVLAGNGSSFFNANTSICKSIRDQLRKDTLSSPVRFPQERLGEVCNLKDPEAQDRSCAQILARKYCTESQFLRNIYNAGIRRELSPKECQAVFQIVRKLGNAASDTKSNDCGHRISLAPGSDYDQGVNDETGGPDGEPDPTHHSGTPSSHESDDEEDGCL